jgi:hypothetical protein
MVPALHRSQMVRRSVKHASDVELMRVVAPRIQDFFPFHSGGDAGRGPTQIRRAEEAINSGVAIIGDCRE